MELIIGYAKPIIDYLLKIEDIIDYLKRSKMVIIDYSF